MSGWWWVFLFHSLVRNIEIWNWQSWSTRTIRNWSSWDKDREERRGVQVCAPFDRSSSHTRHRIAEINQRKISVFDKNACIIVEITTHLHTANRVLSNDRDALTWFRMMVKFKRLDHHITTSLSIVLDPRNHKRRENHQNDVSITLNHQDVSLHPIKSEKYFIESSINLSKKVGCVCARAFPYTVAFHLHHPHIFPNLPFDFRRCVIKLDLSIGLDIEWWYTFTIICASSFTCLRLSPCPRCVSWLLYGFCGKLTFEKEIRDNESLSKSFAW